MIFNTLYMNENIEIKENEVPVIVIESPSVLSSLIRDLIKQKGGEDGENVFSENHRPISVKKYIDIIIDPFNLDLNQTKIINGTLKYMDYIANGEMGEQTLHLRNSLESYAEIMIQEIQLPLYTDSIWDISKVIKAMGIHYEDNTLEMVEKLLQYIKISSFLFGTKCFVFLNLKQYLEREEIIAFYRDVSLEKANILLLESSVSYELENENIIILDKDLCVL